MFDDRLDEMKKGGVNKEIVDNFKGQYNKFKLDPSNIEKEKANMRLQTARVERNRRENPKPTVIITSPKLS